MCPLQSLLPTYYSSRKISRMTAKKYSASMDDGLLEEVARAAEEEGVTVSAWLTRAAIEAV